MKVAVLTGGVGGAKFVDGLARCGLVSQLTAIVNTGDDFRHLGLAISPDIDTLLYTLAGKANRTLGWGREDESWAFMAALKELGGPDWFNLGDGDLAKHVLRSDRLAHGDRLSAITADFAAAWGIEATILPMSDDPVATWIDTFEGPLPFQNYFVQQRCVPVARAIRFEGASDAKPAPHVLDAIADADAIFIAPSNPYLSVDPILAITAITSALRAAAVPVITISPIVDGAAVKGPTTKLMTELGIAISNDSIALHYHRIADAMVYDGRDAAPASLPGIATNTLMHDDADRQRVAIAAIHLAKQMKR